MKTVQKIAQTIEIGLVNIEKIVNLMLFFYFVIDYTLCTEYH